MLKKFTYILMTIVFATFIAACTSTMETPVGNTQGASQETMQKAIIFACKNRGWSYTVESSNSMVASLLKREHSVSVRIVFDSQNYSINFISASNLDYDASNQTIHRNYNRWVKNLKHDIDAALLQVELLQI